MPARAKPRPEAVTAARWWGDKLRDLAPTLRPVTAISEAQFVGEPEDYLEEVTKTAQYRIAVKLYHSLTDQNIRRFEELLATHIETTMAAHQYGVCGVSQTSKYDIEPELGRALRGAGIETRIGPVEPVFDWSMVTLSKPGEVWAAGGFIEAMQEPYHQLLIIDE